MKILAIFAHPKATSLNHSILEAVQQEALAKGHELRTRDLYEMNFNPVLSSKELGQADGKVPNDVLQEQEHITWAEVLIFIYPIWWYDRPAILKGWIDRVMTHGFAYGPSPHGITGLFKHRKALVFQTAGASEKTYQDNGGSAIVEKSMSNGMLRYCGIQDVDVHTFYSVFTASSEQIAEIMNRVKQSISSLQ